MKNFNTFRKNFVKTIFVLFFISFTRSAFAGLVNLEGPAPEQATTTVTVKKPANAIYGHILLNVFDADQLNEGELIINGNKAITLFGESGVSANDGKSVYMFLQTPASYWKDGSNTLLFKHTRTGGYVIDQVLVQFEVSTTAPEPAPAPAPDPDVNSGAFPVDLTGPAPEEDTITISVTKPSNATNGLITLDVFDADQLNEGELIINGNKAITLFGSAGVNANDVKQAKVTFSTPASYWKDGDNTLRFRHTRTGGYVIDDVIVKFEVSTTAPAPEPAPAPVPTPDPDVNSGAFPVDLEGAAPEEATITISVNKPSNATNGLITLDVYDADQLNEGELIINGNKAITLFGSAGVGANDAKSTTVTFSTPASYWKDGNNTLRFRHTRTGGYVIDDVIVTFEVSTTTPAPAPAPEPTPEPAPEPDNSGAFPVDLEGAAPEEATITISVNKPSNALNGYITLNVYDADQLNEGELIINGNKAIILFGSAGVGANDAKSTTVTFSTPASYWKDGNNTLRFKHTRTGGYVIDDVIVTFDSGSNQTGSGSVSLSWVAPVERTDNTALAMNDIAGYTVYYGTSQGNYTNSYAVSDNYATTATITGMQAGTYYLVITTKDTNGLESGYSSMVTKQTQ